MTWVFPTIENIVEIAIIVAYCIAKFPYCLGSLLELPRSIVAQQYETLFKSL